MLYIKYIFNVIILYLTNIRTILVSANYISSNHNNILMTRCVAEFAFSIVQFKYPMANVAARLHTFIYVCNLKTRAVYIIQLSMLEY